MKTNKTNKNAKKTAAKKSAPKAKKNLNRGKLKVAVQRSNADVAAKLPAAEKAVMARSKRIANFDPRLGYIVGSVFNKACHRLAKAKKLVFRRRGPVSGVEYEWFSTPKSATKAKVSAAKPKKGAKPAKKAVKSKKTTK